MKLLEALSALGAEEFLLTNQIDARCPDSISEEHVCVIRNLIEAIETSHIFQTSKGVIQQRIDSGNFDKCVLNRAGVGVDSCYTMIEGSVQTTCSVTYSGKQEVAKTTCCKTLTKGFGNEHYVAVLLMIWPYGKCEGTNGLEMKKIVSQSLSKAHEVSTCRF